MTQCQKSDSKPENYRYIPLRSTHLVMLIATNYSSFKTFSRKKTRSQSTYNRMHAIPPFLRLESGSFFSFFRWRQNREVRGGGKPFVTSASRLYGTPDTFHPDQSRCTPRRARRANSPTPEIESGIPTGPRTWPRNRVSSGRGRGGGEGRESARSHETRNELCPVFGTHPDSGRGGRVFPRLVSPSPPPHLDSRDMQIYSIFQFAPVWFPAWPKERKERGRKEGRKGRSGNGEELWDGENRMAGDTFGNKRFEKRFQVYKAC